MSGTEAVLNPWLSQGEERESLINARATETVSVEAVRVGDTVIDYNTHNLPVYRVVAEAELWPGGPGLAFDTDRDVPGPRQSYVTISHGSRGYQPGALVKRVTDLGDWEMTRATHLRPLDKLADGRGVWQVAAQVSKDKQSLIRFAGSDNFTKMPLSTVVLVEGRRINRHVVSEMRKAREGKGR